MSKASDDNRSNQLNPNNDAYHSSRGTSRDDDDGDDTGKGTSAYWVTSPKYVPKYSFHEFVGHRVLSDLTVEAVKLTVRGRESMDSEDAMETALRATSQGAVFCVLWDSVGRVKSSRQPLIRPSKVKSRLNTLQLCARWERGLSYRDQANDLREEHDEIFKAIRDVIESLPDQAPSGVRQGRWTKARNDLQQRFSSNQRSSQWLGNVKLAEVVLKEFGQALFPSFAQAEALDRRRRVLIEAAIHLNELFEPRDGGLDRPHDEWRRNRELRAYLQKIRQADAQQTVIDAVSSVRPSDGAWTDYGVVDA